MREDHDFFFVKKINDPDVKNALVVPPGKKEKKKKKKKKEDKVEEEPEVILWFTNAVYFRFCISGIWNIKLKPREILNQLLCDFVL